MTNDQWKEVIRNAKPSLPSNIEKEDPHDTMGLEDWAIVVVLLIFLVGYIPVLMMFLRGAQWLWG